MHKKQLFQFLSLAIVLVAVDSITQFSTLPIGNTVLWWTLQIFMLFGFWLFKQNLYKTANSASMLLVSLFLGWMMFNGVRGLFIARGYWDYKALVDNIMIFLIPLAAFACTNMLFNQRMLSKYIKYALPLFVVLVSFLPTDAYGFYLIPISLLLLFLPALKLRWKGVILSLALLVVFIDFSARSNVIKFGVPLLLLGVYYFRQVFSRRVLETVRLVLIAAPLIFFILGITGTFNIFNISQYIQDDYTVTTRDATGKTQKSSLTSDTRSFIYVDVLRTAQKYNSWWFGRSLTHGYETTAFGNLIRGNERGKSEAAIPNIFTYAGIVGVILYLLVFFRASYLAVNRSNNIYSKMLGLFIAFRWSYAWVEDQGGFNLNYLFIWFMIGMCFSNEFRQMTNREVKYWARGIFNVKYAKAWWLLVNKKTKKLIN